MLCGADAGYFVRLLTHMIRLAALLLTALASLPPSYAAAPERDIPKATWEPIYFRSINQLSDKAGWRPLRDIALRAESFEVSVWIGFGIGPLADRKTALQLIDDGTIHGIHQHSLLPDV